SAWRRTLEAYVKTSTRLATGSYFGNTVALSTDGSTLAVAAVQDRSLAKGVGGDESDASGEQVGAVHMFSASNGGWSRQAYVKAPDAHSRDIVGVAVAVSADGDTLAIGARAMDGSGKFANPAQGLVHLYRRAAGAWSYEATVQASNAVPQDDFGSTVSLSADGNTLAVGAADESDGAKVSDNACYGYQDK